jgi:hypothetical protein
MLFGDLLVSEYILPPALAGAALAYADATAPVIEHLMRLLI